MYYAHFNEKKLIARMKNLIILERAYKYNMWYYLWLF